VTDHDDLVFNEVFFTDVLVPAENLVGDLNERLAGGRRVTR
jgi:alkylation response protein AidB-like acyl-CoA dehydrogenase